MKDEKAIKFQLAGWGLFIVCAVFFLASGLKNRDMLTVVGSAIFFAACWLFLVPLLDSLKRKEDGENG